MTDKYGIDEIFFEDDNFTANRERALEILDRMASLPKPVHLKFANGIRADLVDKEILQMMKRAGVYSLSFGVESGSSATLTAMKKKLDLDLTKKNILLAKSMGFLVGSNCIIGYPGESPANIQESFEFFFGLPLDSMAIVNLIPFPGTEVRKICEKKGYLTDKAMDWDNYYFSINNPLPLIETPLLSAEEVIKFIKKAYRKMYLRPKWLLNSLRHISIPQIAPSLATMLGIGRSQAKDNT